MTTFAILLLSIVPVDLVARDQTDIVEQNFFYDFEGRLVFEQIIWFDEHDDVIAWRLNKMEGIRPQFDWHRGDYVSRWHDDIQGFNGFREVRARFMRTTHTQHDPELEARERLPVEMRRGLGKGKR